MTWGFGVGINWNPWTGWDVGFGWGGYRPVYRPWWGPYYGWRPRPRPAYYGQPPYSGRPAPYGRPPGIQINNINVYNRPGAPRPGVRPAVRPVARPASPASARPGGAAPRTQPDVRQAPTTPGGRPGATQPSTRPAPSRPDNLYAGPDGNVYRSRPAGGWETNDSGKWKPVQPARPETRPQETRPAPDTRPGQTRTAPQPSRSSVDPSTLNQLSRDRQGRQNADARMSPPPSARPPSSAPRSAPAPRPQASRPPRP
jgi:translation initiation factor IF-2